MTAPARGLRASTTMPMSWCSAAACIGAEVAKDCLKIFLTTEFEGGRHARRVAKLS